MLLLKRPANWLKTGINLFLLAVCTCLSPKGNSFRAIYIFAGNTASKKRFIPVFNQCIMLLLKRPANWLKTGINLFLLAVLPANIYMARKELPQIHLLPKQLFYVMVSILEQYF
jgi:uncharacterized membrane protein